MVLTRLKHDLTMAGAARAPGDGDQRTGHAAKA